MIDKDKSSAYIPTMARYRPSQPDHVKQLIKEMGGPVRVGAILGKSSQSVSQWLLIPADDGVCLTLEKATGMDRCRMRPDVYPPDDYRRL